MKLSIVTSYYNCEKYIEEQFPGIDVKHSYNIDEALALLEKKSPALILGSLYLAGDVLSSYQINTSDIAKKISSLRKKDNNIQACHRKKKRKYSQAN